MKSTMKWPTGWKMRSVILLFLGGSALLSGLMAQESQPESPVSNFRLPKAGQN
jgi:hypothetical protein